MLARLVLMALATKRFRCIRPKFCCVPQSLPILRYPVSGIRNPMTNYPQCKLQDANKSNSPRRRENKYLLILQPRGIICL